MQRAPSETRAAKLVRFGVSIEEGLAASFDRSIAAKGYRNRSEAIRDMIRDRLTEEASKAGGRMMGVIVLVYDHHRPKLVEKLLELQHNAGADIVASQHVHLDHHHCMETIVVRGTAAKLEALQGRMGALKGVGQCRLAKTSCRALH
jgi:CopG family nickel-responsive transcriptional regulator